MKHAFACVFKLDMMLVRDVPCTFLCLLLCSPCTTLYICFFFIEVLHHAASMHFHLTLPSLLSNQKSHEADKIVLEEGKRGICLHLLWIFFNYLLQTYCVLDSAVCIP